jgi:hypothetical protein
MYIYFINNHWRQYFSISAYTEIRRDVVISDVFIWENVSLFWPEHFCPRPFFPRPPSFINIENLKDEYVWNYIQTIEHLCIVFSAG